jgi:UDP-N-acetylmuramoyl-tripeptide--D-alanyl-D-alanine ligase
MIRPDELLGVPHLRADLGADAGDVVFSGVSTDSRTVRPGDLFFAIRGEKFDGHQFVAAACDRGAAAVVVDNRWAGSLPPNSRSLIVGDTTTAYGRLATIYRRKFRIPVIAVAGSNGKTTTKEMIAAVLGSRLPVLKTEANLNNHIGVPQTLFRLDSTHKVAVVEIGTNHPGELRYLCSVLEPTHGIITNIGREHLEFFRTLAGVAREEGALLDWLAKHRGTAFINADDERLRVRARKVGSCVSYGFTAPHASVRGRFIGTDERGCAAFNVRPKGKKEFSVRLCLPGAHEAANGLAAAAIGLRFGIPASRIRTALESWTGVGKRMEVLTAGGVTIINDTYNANPDSVLAALETAATMPCRGRRILLLADMLELGDTAVREHEQIGSAVARMGFEYCLTYGPLAAAITAKAKIPVSLHYEQKNMLSEYAAELLSAGDVVLVKGSRGMKMEDVVLFLAERLRGREER